MYASKKFYIISIIYKFYDTDVPDIKNAVINFFNIIVEIISQF